MKRVILVKFGELFLKGQNRDKFEKALLDDIRSRISKFGEFRVRKIGAVFSIDGEKLDEIISVVGKIFGISRFSIAWEIEKNIEDIKLASEMEVKKFNVKTFKIEAKRTDKKFQMNSLEICKELGTFISEKFNLNVDVHNPDLILTIEIRNKAYIFSQNYEGMGGLPAGTSGVGTVLISGGLDSPVAAFMMAKRGLRLIAVHFSTPPYTSQRSVDKVKRLLKKVSEFSGRIQFFNINFSKIQEKIKKTCSDNLTTIISRRFMNRIAQKISFNLKSSCLITGESLGQVASQTVASMNCTSHEVSLPLFRPLIGFDKDEIVKIAKKIGTFDISIEAFDDCCSLFSPANPKINPLLKFVQNEELKIGSSEDLLEDAIKNCEICEII